MMQMSHHAGANIVVLPRIADRSETDSLSPVSMARYLRETSPLSAHCFALQMQKQSAWANDSWGTYWGDVASLV